MKSINIYYILIGGLVSSVLFWIIFGLTVRLSLFIFFFIIIFNVILKYFEKEKSTETAKILIDRFFRTLAAVFLFLGSRIVFGNIFNMPLDDSLQFFLKNYGWSSQFITNVRPIIAAEIILFGLNLFVSIYMTTRSGFFARWVFALMAISALFIIIWQIKQPDNTEARKQKFQLGVDKDTSRTIFNNLEDEQIAADRFMETTEVVSYIYKEEIQDGHSIISPVEVNLRKGRAVQLMDEHIRTIDSLPMLKIRLPVAKTGEFLGSNLVFFCEARFLQKKKTGKITKEIGPFKGGGEDKKLKAIKWGKDIPKGSEVIVYAVGKKNILMIKYDRTGWHNEPNYPICIPKSLKNGFYFYKDKQDNYETLDVVAEEGAEIYIEYW